MLLLASAVLLLGVVADVDDVGKVADIAAIVAIVAALAFIAVVLPGLAAGGSSDEAEVRESAEQHRREHL